MCVCVCRRGWCPIQTVSLLQVPIHLGQDPAVCEQGTAAPDGAPPNPCCRGRASLLQGPGLLRFTLGDTRHPVTPPAPLLPTAPTQVRAPTWHPTLRRSTRPNSGGSNQHPHEDWAAREHSSPEDSITETLNLPLLSSCTSTTTNLFLSRCFTPTRSLPLWFHSKIPSLSLNMLSLSLSVVSLQHTVSLSKHAVSLSLLFHSNIMSLSLSTCCLSL